MVPIIVGDVYFPSLGSWFHPRDDLGLSTLGVTVDFIVLENVGEMPCAFPRNICHILHIVILLTDMHSEFDKIILGSS